MAAINTSSIPANVLTEHSTNEKAPINFFNFSPSAADTQIGSSPRFSISVPGSKDIITSTVNRYVRLRVTYENNGNVQSTLPHL